MGDWWGGLVGQGDPHRDPGRTHILEVSSAPFPEVGSEAQGRHLPEGQLLVLFTSLFCA